jgi:F420-dependent methylenetetrahydromethanopterin dehydrogenase
MNVAIVGSRTFMDMKAMEVVVKRLLERDPDVVIVSGGARGADTLAETAARKLCKNAPLIFPADWAKHGKSAGPRRNQQIVDASDQLIGFWDGASRGTIDSVRRALIAGKPVFVYHTTDRRWLDDEEITAFTRPTRPTQQSS